MRFFSGQKEAVSERLLWSRDIRFANRLADTIEGARVLELEAGMVVIAPAWDLTDARAAELAALVHSPAYGLVDLDPALPEGERHLAAMSEAASGIVARDADVRLAAMIQQAGQS